MFGDAIQLERFIEQLTIRETWQFSFRRSTRWSMLETQGKKLLCTPDIIYLRDARDVGEAIAKTRQYCLVVPQICNKVREYVIAHSPPNGSTSTRMDHQPRCER